MNALKKIPLLSNWKENLAYLIVLAIVWFMLSKAIWTISNADKISSTPTLPTDQVVKVIQECRGPVPFANLIQLTDLLAEHGRFEEAKACLENRLQNIPYKGQDFSGKDMTEREILMRKIARIEMKTVKFKLAEANLKRAMAISVQANNKEEQLQVLVDQMDLYSQTMRFSKSKREKDYSQDLLNNVIGKINDLVAGMNIDDGTKRLITNQAKLALIEQGRLLEVESFQPDPRPRAGP